MTEQQAAEQQAADFKDTVESLAPLVQQGLIAGCKREIEAGAVVGDYRYGCRVEDQINYNSLLELLAPDNSTMLPVTCYDVAKGEWLEVAHTYSMVKSVAAWLAQHVYITRIKLKTKLADLEQATTVEEVEKISW